MGTQEPLQHSVLGCDPCLHGDMLLSSCTCQLHCCTVSRHRATCGSMHTGCGSDQLPKIRRGNRAAKRYSLAIHVSSPCVLLEKSGYLLRAFVHRTGVRQGQRHRSTTATRRRDNRSAPLDASRGLSRGPRRTHGIRRGPPLLLLVAALKGQAESHSWCEKGDCQTKILPTSCVEDAAYVCLGWVACGVSCQTSFSMRVPAAASSETMPRLSMVSS
jgi:hypothetical protein